MAAADSARLTPDHLRRATKFRCPATIRTLPKAHAVVPRHSEDAAIPTVTALAAIALWSTLATLGVALAHLPPFLLTGVALLVGALPGLPKLRAWRVSWSTLALGVYGLFGFHCLLFMALRFAPPLEANLVNYTWPLWIVLLTPLFLPGWRLGARHLVAGLVGFAGAAVAIAGGRRLGGGDTIGFLFAGASAVVWATYSLASRRAHAFPTAAVGAFCLLSGLLALGCHLLFEPRVAIGTDDVPLLVALGLGPMGAAFYLWDRAIKHGDPRRIGVLAYLTPVLSTALLHLHTGRPLDFPVVSATALILGAALIVMRAEDSLPNDAKA
jgi:drug/metabolite transporter (DMT)-like permease